MVRRKKEVTLPDGRTIEVDMSDARISFGSGKELDSIDEFFREEEIEKSIREALKSIDAVSQRHSNKVKNLNYYSEVGRILQFVDSEDLYDQRGLVWERMAHNLRPDLFGGKRKNSTESKRHPEFMYLLGKQPRKVIHRANWDQWYEIVKFPRAREDTEIMEEVLKICETTNPSAMTLRKLIKEILEERI